MEMTFLQWRWLFNWIEIFGGTLKDQYENLQGLKLFFS